VALAHPIAIFACNLESLKMTFERQFEILLLVIDIAQTTQRGAFIRTVALIQRQF
jgi:hypothetical protein